MLTGGAVLAATPDAASKIELFDLGADPAEARNLAASEPDRVAELRALLADFGRMQQAGVTAYAEGRRGFKAPTDWVIRD